ncbi:galactokinase [Paraferrimonas sp. SM1919]|uniref:galactokinase n=1 Tax=Paraferrimonas sp. SM1919 TaxID=2662263 RepID=UPI0013CFF358|nr:galactokinase [Paraferrimonas sp. SM1919]
MQSPEQLAGALFSKHFKSQPEAIFIAPARVNLIGGHTDYNEGYVLPTAINLYTAIAISKRDDLHFNAISHHYSDPLSWHANELDQFQASSKLNGNWGEYLKGVCRSFIDTGLDIAGMNIAIASNVPVKCGLASSAALEVGFAKAMNHCQALELSPLALAQLCQRAESQYIGFECGIMDHITSACAEEGHALLIDCMDLDPQPVSIPDNLSLLIIKPEVSLSRTANDYANRQRECKQVVDFFGLNSLRELTYEQLLAAKSQLDPILFKRAHHVISENNRVYQASKALKRGQIDKFSLLMRNAHASMRDDFDLSLPEIDNLVEMLSDTIGNQGGVRVTGGGVGGCVVVLVEHELTEKVINIVENDFVKNTGLETKTYLCTASSGAFKL